MKEFSCSFFSAPTKFRKIMDKLSFCSSFSVPTNFRKIINKTSFYSLSASTNFKNYEKNPNFLIKLNSNDVLLKNINWIQQYQFGIHNSFLFVYFHFMRADSLSIIKNKPSIRHSVLQVNYQFLAQQRGLTVFSSKNRFFGCWISKTIFQSFNSNFGQFFKSGLLLSACTGVWFFGCIGLINQFKPTRTTYQPPLATIGSLAGQSQIRGIPVQVSKVSHEEIPNTLQKSISNLHQTQPSQTPFVRSRLIRSNFLPTKLDKKVVLKNENELRKTSVSGTVQKKIIETAVTKTAEVLFSARKNIAKFAIAQKKAEGMLETDITAVNVRESFNQIANKLKDSQLTATKRSK